MVEKTTKKIKKLLIILLFIPNILNAGEYFQPFTKKDWILQLGFTFLATIDWMQTKEFTANHPDLEERNPILGRDPSQVRIDTYMIFNIAAHGLATYAIDPKYREPWQMVFIIVEINSVNINYNNSIRISISYNY